MRSSLSRCKNAATRVAAPSAITILLHGSEGSPDNFYLSIGVLGGDFVSPRHRHNFDQVRFQLEGTCDFASDGTMRPGSIAYFPGGTRYGPQKSIDLRTLTLVSLEADNLLSKQWIALGLLSHPPRERLGEIIDPKPCSYKSANVAGRQRP